MQIIDLTKEWLPQAIRLAEENYAEARAQLSCLPELPIPPLNYFAENGLGVAAVENGVLLGYLGGCDPWRPVYCTPDTAGVYSPLHAHAVQKENRAKIWQRLYQAAGAKWAKAGAASHAITIYARDVDTRDALFLYGFGARCADFMRPLTDISAPLCPAEIRFTELPAAESARLRPLRRALADHLGQSPAFMLHTEQDMNAYLDRKEQQAARMFTALHGERIIAYIELDDDGETFASCAPGTGNICGAYCLPEYRGQGIAPALLQHILRTLQNEGYARLGVDCETFNPTAMGFWSKHFTQYTTSVVRRIDENAVIVP